MRMIPAVRWHPSIPCTSRRQQNNENRRDWRLEKVMDRLMNEEDPEETDDGLTARMRRKKMVDEEDEAKGNGGNSGGKCEED